MLHFNCIFKYICIEYFQFLINLLLLNEKKSYKELFLINASFLFAGHGHHYVGQNRIRCCSGESEVDSDAKQSESL